MQYIFGVLIFGLIVLVIKKSNKKVDKGFIDEMVKEHNDKEKGWYRGQYNSTVNEYKDFYADVEDVKDNARKN